MMRKLKYQILLLLLLVGISRPSSFAQNYSLQMYNFNNVGQSTLFNPATQVQSNVTIGLFNLGLQTNTPDINLADVFKKGENFNTVISNLMTQPNKSLNRLSLASHAGVFVGFRLLKNNYISLGAYSYVNVQASVSKDLLNLLGNGTNPYLNQTLQLAPTVASDVNLVYHIGYSRKINKQFSAGMRLKLISGIQTVRSTGNELNLTVTNDDPLTTYRYRLSANYALSVNNHSVINTALNGGALDLQSLIFKNGINGFGLDFGLVYKINNKWSISASLLDVGAMYWSNDVATYNKYVTNTNISGLQFVGLSKLYSDQIDLQAKADSLLKIVTPDTTYHPFSYSLSSKFYLGTEYNIATYTKLGATFFGHVNPTNQFDYAFGVWASHKFWSILDLKAGWSMFNNDPANLSVGFSLNLGYFQIYAMTENILPAFEYDQAHRFNVQLGVNFNFGLNLDKDRDGVPNRKDKCVKIPGLEIFDGCPDTDKDSVPDNIDSCVNDSGAVSNHGCPLSLDKDGDSVLDVNDSCPDIKGLKTAFGCPDKDEDGVPDYKDSCIDQVGTALTNGCPDEDGDGIADKIDSCKSIAGRTEFFGCPTEEALIAARFDQDGDRVPDSLDKCPDLAGSELLNGCPDYDGDGIADPQDECMEIAGDLEFNGCPDTDNDGVPDYLDECITLFGSKANKGCPSSIGINGLGGGNNAGGGNGVDEAGINGDANNVIRNIALNPNQSKVLVEAFKFLQFRFQSSSILETSYPVLDELSKLLMSTPNSRLILIGYTDAVGDDFFNQTLSYQRASSVKKYLMDKGVTNKIDLFGFGENNPVATNETPQGRAKNRRVEMAILPE